MLQLVSQEEIPDLTTQLFSQKLFDSNDIEERSNENWLDEKESLGEEIVLNNFDSVEEELENEGQNPLGFCIISEMYSSNFGK